MSNINKIMEAYLGMVSGEKTVDEAKKSDKGGVRGKDGRQYTVQMNQDRGKLSFRLTNQFGDFKTVSAKEMGKLFEEVELEEGCGDYDKKSKKEDKKLDPVDDAENDKKFKNRKDKDIDNDGDVDSSDEFLHKKRKATDDAIDGGKKPAVKEEKDEEEESDEEPKDKKKKPFPPKKKDEEEPEVEPETDGDSEIKKNPKTADKKAEISKIESVDTRSSFEKMWSEIAEAIDPKKGATTPEKHDDHSSEHDKEVIKKHKKSDKKIEDQEEESHDVTFKAGGKDMKQASARSGADNLSNGDKTPKK